MDSKLKVMEEKIEKIPVNSTKEKEETKQNASATENSFKSLKDDKNSNNKVSNKKNLLKKKIKWIGTSMSNVLDKEKVEKALDVELKISKKN